MIVAARGFILVKDGVGRMTLMLALSQALEHVEGKE
jgi:hypothetical protein